MHHTFISKQCHWWHLVTFRDDPVNEIAKEAKHKVHIRRDTSIRKNTQKKREQPPEPKGPEELEEWHKQCQVMAQMRSNATDLDKEWHKKLSDNFGFEV